MKALSLAIAMLLLSVIYANAQINGCTNLVNPFYTTTQITKISNPGLNYARTGYVNGDVSYLSDSLSGKPCSVSTACASGNAILNYEVYYPNVTYSDANKLPAFVMFHSGGFSDCSSNQNGAEQVCMQFAQRGYVAFNIEYRRGRNEDPQTKYTSASHWLALYRGVQDGRGALRTIVQRELDKSQPYRIDTSKIFVGGTSSGTDLALMVAYFTDDMMNKLFTGVSTVLGAPSVNKYAGNARYRIRGVLDMWGGFPVPVSYAANPVDFIKLSPNIPPIIAFHGNKDKEVNIATSNKFFSEGSIYNSETLCTSGKTFALPSNGRSVSDFKLLGSQGLYDILKGQLGIKSELYIDCDMGHGLQQGESDFGLGSSVPNKDVQAYIVQRAVTFFQYITNQSFPSALTHTRFVDCVNPRSGCLGDASTLCSNTAVCPASSIAAVTTEQQVVVANKAAVLGEITITQQQKSVVVSFSKPSPSTVNIFSITGTRMLSKKINGTPVTIHCSNYAAGIYIVQVIKDVQTTSKKIVL